MFTKEALAMLPERLYLASHFSLLRYSSQATNLRKRERKSIHELKIYCELEQANNSFQPNFHLGVLRLA